MLSRFEAAQAFVVGSIPIHVVLTGFALAVGVGVIGGLYPAIRATGLQPTEALRHD
jgi:putative ABC transport system permease protein